MIRRPPRSTLFPYTPLFVGRKKSILALEEVMRSDTFILLATQKNASDDEPATEAIYEIGTLASVLQLLKLPDGTVKVLVEGAQRAKVVKYTDCSEYHEAEAVALGDTLGERVEAKALARSVTNEIEDKIKKTKLSKEAREKATHELKKLRQMAPMSAESTVVRNYLDWLLSIPWAKRSKIKKDLKLAQEVLDNDHFGLDKVKERIVEYLAVQQRANKLTGPILCLVGPAGVGKTSLGRSIARATGRDFVRFSLGGGHDEAAIRGP